MMQVKLEKFEGPLSLLLQIIEKEELDITEISLSRIADEYLAYIKAAVGGIKSEEMADFLVVAARLLLIKSRALLPYLFPEEEAEIEEFEQQLRMYKEFVDASKKIQEMAGKQKFMFVREFNRKAVMSNLNSFYPPKNLKAADMAMVYADLLGRIKPPEKLAEETLERKVNIEEKIIFLQNQLISRIKVSFSKLLAEAESKTEVIVSFLAMLELMKQRVIIVEQGELFEEIFISRNEMEGGRGIGLNLGTAL